MNKKAELQNPFVGLRPFESEDSLYYFGRDEQTKALLQQLHQTRFLAVVGSSGSGKSSLVRAGLIPNLEAGFLVQDRDIWQIAKMKPGETPINNLAASLLDVTSEKPSFKQVKEFAEGIRNGGLQFILKHLQPSLDRNDTNMLLLVDQFEEIFRFGLNEEFEANQEEIADFVNILLELAAQNTIPVFVTLTMRSDFLGDCDVFHGLPEAMNRSQYLVPRLTREQRRKAITGPVHISGTRITQRLVDRLLNESANNQDDLPVLQHALMRTWSYWRENNKGHIDIEHYEEIKTLKKALSQHAKEALTDMNDDELLLTKRLFQTLTETDAGNRRVRRPAKLSEIEAITCASRHEIWKIIQKFRSDGRSFLVLSSENLNENPMIDISHESLIRQWIELKQWVDKEARSAKMYMRLAQTAVLYEKEKAGLWHNPDLQYALNWKEKNKPNRFWAQRYHPAFERAMSFLDNSKKKSGEEKIAKERLRKRIIFGLIAVIVLVSGLGILAALKWLDAKIVEKERDTIIARSLTMQAKSTEDDPYLLERSVLLAIESFNRLKDLNSSYIEPEQTILRGLILLPRQISRMNHEREVTSVTFSPDGKYVATGSYDKTARVWDISSGKEKNRMEHRGSVTAVVFSPDGKYLATGSIDRAVWIWDISTGKKKQRMVHKKVTSTERVSGQPRFRGSRLSLITFNHDGKYLATVIDDRIARIWDVTSGEEIIHMTHEDKVTAVTFNPDGKYLATGCDDKTARVWNATSGEEITRMTHENKVTAVTFDPDGKYLATRSYDRMSRVWDATSGKEIARMIHKDRVTTIAFSPDGRYVATGSYDKTARVWDITGGKGIVGITYGKYATGFQRYYKSSVTFSPDGKYLATGIDDKTIRIWDITSGKEVSHMTHDDKVTAVSFSPDGKYVATSSYDKITRIWDVTNGKEKQRMTLEKVTSTESVTRQPRFRGSRSSFITFNHDGKYLATVIDGKIARIWDAASGKEVSHITHDDRITAVTFSPDGKYVATGNYDKTARVWNTTNGEKVASITHKSKVTAVAFSPDGKYVASGSYDKIVRVWDVTSGEEVELTTHEGGVRAVAFSPDGKYLATGNSDKSASVWDWNRNEEVASITHKSKVTAVAFSPDGKYLTSGGAKSVFVWVWQPDAIIENACDCISRNLSYEEWQMYLTGEQYKKTCPELPIHDSFIKAGEKMAKVQNTEGAIDIFQHALKLDSSLQFDPKIKAQQIAEKALIEKVQNLKQKGQSLAKKGYIEDAVAKFQEALKLDPNSGLDPSTVAQQIAGKAFLEKGRKLARSGDVEGAVARLKEAKSYDPNLQFDPKAKAQQFAKGKTLQKEGEDLARSGDVKGAAVKFRIANSIDQYLNLIPKTKAKQIASKAMVSKGKTLARSGDVESAVAKFKEALKLDPNLGFDPKTEAKQIASMAIVNEGRDLARSGDIEGAVAKFQEAIKLDPDLGLDPTTEAKQIASKAMVSKGKNLAWSGDVEGAVAEFQRALGLDPRLKLNPEKEAHHFAAQSLVTKGSRIVRQGQVKEALDAFAKAQELDPDLEISPYSWNDLCWDGSLYGYAADVVFACEKALEIDGKNGFFYDSSGLARALTGDYEGAIEDFESALKWVKKGSRNKEWFLKRKKWIGELKYNRDPFNEATLKTLQE